MDKEIDALIKKKELVQVLIDISNAVPRNKLFSRKRYLSYMELERFIQRIDNYIDKYYVRRTNGLKS